MFKSALAIFALGLSSVAVAQNSTASTQKVGWTGTLSSLDGGLGGNVAVIDDHTLEITSYTLKDASAPALYWWGTTDGVIKDGFRISNEHITQAATSPTVRISLDAGKTTADFTTVGLWCERLSANFGQATLKAPSGTPSTPSGPSNSPSGSASSASSASASASASSKSAAANVVGSYTAVASAFLAVVGFATWMA